MYTYIYIYASGAHGGPYRAHGYSFVCVCFFASSCSQYMTRLHRNHWQCVKRNRTISPEGPLCLYTLVMEYAGHQKDHGDVLRLVKSSPALFHLSFSPFQ